MGMKRAVTQLKPISDERLTFLTKNIMSGSPKCSDDSKTKISELYTLNLIYSMGLKSYVNIFGLVD